jgi:hypothetical protein
MQKSNRPLSWRLGNSPPSMLAHRHQSVLLRLRYLSGRSGHRSGRSHLSGPSNQQFLSDRSQSTLHQRVHSDRYYPSAQ